MKDKTKDKINVGDYYKNRGGENVKITAITSDIYKPVEVARQNGERYYVTTYGQSNQFIDSGAGDLMTFLSPYDFPYLYL